MSGPFPEYDQNGHGDQNGGFDEAGGTCEGRTFPGEAEWLSLPPPPIAPDFAERTLAALREQAGDGGDLPLPRELLAAHRAPEPSREFAARTLQALADDRAARWRELLARHVAPEPSPEFVARTLAALARDDGERAPAHPRAIVPRRRWTWPLLLVAAALMFAVALYEPPPAPLELRIARQVRPEFAHAYAVSPLPAVLAALDRQADPLALPNSGPDGFWLLQRRDR